MTSLLMRRAAPAAAPATLRMPSAAAATVSARTFSSSHVGVRCTCSACSSASSLRSSSCIAAAAASVPSTGSRGFASKAPPRSHTVKRPSGPLGPTTPAPPRAAAPSAATRSAPAAVSTAPTLNAVLKKFNLLVHPDLFANAPTHARANQTSLQALNSLLSTLKSRETENSYPVKQVQQLVFYLKKKRGDERWVEYIRQYDLQTHLTFKAPPPGRIGAARSGVPLPGYLPPRGNADTLEGEFHTVPIVVSTNGGHCKKQVADQLSSLFYRCGLPFQWTWDEEYWRQNDMHAQRDDVDAGDLDDDEIGFHEDGTPKRRKSPAEKAYEKAQAKKAQQPQQQQEKDTEEEQEETQQRKSSA